MELGLKGKTVIVTGAGSNIGRGIFLKFVQEGSNVVMAEIDEKQGNKVLELGKSLNGGGKLMLVKTDVTSMDSIQNLMKKTVDEMGTLDVLVNVVGWTFDRAFIEKPLEEMQKEITLNLLSTIMCCRAAVDIMMPKKSGKIINLGSDAGRMGQIKEVVYGATKGGVIAFTKGLAREMGRYQINVNCICPGATIPDSKDMVSEEAMCGPKGFGAQIFDAPPEMKQMMAKNYPLGRIGHPDDIAGAALFFASDAASFITGQTLSVSGGFSMVS